MFSYEYKRQYDLGDTIILRWIIYKLEFICIDDDINALKRDHIL